MKRRRLITALGGFVSAGSLAVGSGAFNFGNVERSVSVTVADDDQSFLKLTQRGGGRRSYTDGATETIAFDIPSPDESDYGGTDPAGLGTDSVYRFDQDAAGDETGLFAVENLGTDPVEVYSSQATESGVPSVTIFDVETGDLLTESSPSDPINVGEQLVCGLEIDTSGVDVRQGDYEVPLVINAEIPDE